MRENTRTLELVNALRRDLPFAVVFKHADRITAGMPDISVTLGQRTIWLEAKHVTSDKKLKSKGVQLLTMRRLSKEGLAYFVVYDDVAERTFVVAPEMMDDLGSYREDGKHLSSGKNARDHESVTRWIFNLLSEL